MYRANDEEGNTGWYRRSGKVEFVVANPAGKAGPGAGFESADWPRPIGDEESSQWLSDRLTACYND